MNWRKLQFARIVFVAAWIVMFTFVCATLPSILDPNAPSYWADISAGLAASCGAFFLTTRILAWRRRISEKGLPPTPPPEAIRAGILIGPKYPSPLIAHAIPPKDAA